MIGLSAGQTKSKYACAEPKPESICTPANTCGSATQTCVVDIRKDANGATVEPSTSERKKNKPFCVKAGTKVQFTSSSKNTGFVVDFGPNFPFTPADESIQGGGKKPVEVEAAKAGCYKYSAGACVSGAIYGMCGNTAAEMIILK